ncbi:MAG: hypothetical protein KDC38_10125 [Planctomycetes bacterium]|nr:hypothetical protein [Planctomycetota bacterium]
MPVATFLRQLVDCGRVRVPSLTIGSDASRAAADVGALGPAAVERLHATLREIDGLARREFAGDPPSLDLPSARWAALTFYRACQFVVSREVDPPRIRKILGRAPDFDRTAAIDYSVDLVLRYLPDLIAIARRESPEDPLVNELVALARGWPLSSIGVPGIESPPDERFATIRGCESLLTLYLDRLLVLDDASRVTAEIAAALGTRFGGDRRFCGPAVTARLEEVT